MPGWLVISQLQCWVRKCQSSDSTQLFDLMKYVCFLSPQDLICDTKASHSALTGSETDAHEFLKSIRETFLYVKSNVKPAAFYWYLHCTVFGAAGYIHYNLPAKSNQLLHNGAARTCQQTVAQFYLSIASGSLASITLQKTLLELECSLNG